MKHKLIALLAFFILISGLMVASEEHGDPTACGNITDSTGRDSCYFRAVGTGADISYCEKITVTRTRDLCYSLAVRDGADMSYCEKMTGVDRVGHCKKNSHISFNTFWIGQTIKGVAFLLAVLYVIRRKFKWKGTSPTRKGVTVGLVLWAFFLVLMFTVRIFGRFPPFAGLFLLAPFGIFLFVFLTVSGSASVYQIATRFVILALFSFPIFVVPLGLIGAIRQHIRKRPLIGVVAIILLVAFTLLGYTANFAARGMFR